MNVNNTSYNYCWNPVFDIVLIKDHNIKENDVTNPNKTSLNETQNYEHDGHVISMLHE